MRGATIALTALAGLTAASPVANEARAAGAFTVPQVHKGYRFKSGAVALARTYHKYKASPPKEVSDAANSALAQQGSVTANPEQYDESYLCPVTVGSNSLMLDFDTGSADLWVFSTELPSSEQSGHSLYTLTGTRKSGYTWKIQYGDGSGAAGNVFSDKVVIGPVTATSQAVEAATSVSSSFVSDTDNDGLVGLAFSSINTVSPQQQTTFFDTVKSTLTLPLFAAYLRHAAAGEYDFGFINTAKYSGSLTYVNINNGNGFWESTASGYAVGSGAAVSSSLDVIFDTGTTLLLLPAAACNAYYRQVSGGGYSSSYGAYIFPCSSSLPTFSVILNGYRATIPGSYMSYEPLGNGYCYGGLQSSAGIGFNILGDIFLKSQYVVFDSRGPRVGLAAQK